MSPRRADRPRSRSHARPKGVFRGRNTALALGVITIAAGVGVTVVANGDEGPADRVTANAADAAGGAADDQAAGGASPLASPSASPSPSVSASPSPSATKPAKPKKSASPTVRAKTAPKKTQNTGGSGRSTPATGGGSGSGGSTSGGTEAQVLALVNKERASAGCSPVTENAKLTRAADDYSDVMAAAGVMSHTGPDGSTMTTRVEAAGYLWSTLGENIAQGQADAAAVMNAWMNSPGHRANILNCSFKELGVGVHFGDGGPWWTQNFGAGR